MPVKLNHFSVIPCTLTDWQSKTIWCVLKGIEKAQVFKFSFYCFLAVTLGKLLNLHLLMLFINLSFRIYEMGVTVAPSSQDCWELNEGWLICKECTINVSHCFHYYTWCCLDFIQKEILEGYMYMCSWVPSLETITSLLIGYIALQKIQNKKNSRERQCIQMSLLQHHLCVPVKFLWSIA